MPVDCGAPASAAAFNDFRAPAAYRRKPDRRDWLRCPSALLPDRHGRPSPAPARASSAVTVPSRSPAKNSDCQPERMRWRQVEERASRPVERLHRRTVLDVRPCSLPHCEYRRIQPMPCVIDGGKFRETGKREVPSQPAVSRPVEAVRRGGVSTLNPVVGFPIAPPRCEMELWFREKNGRRFHRGKAGGNGSHARGLFSLHASFPEKSYHSRGINFAPGSAP